MREQAKATEAIYSSFRERGLAHDGFMQVRGQAFSSATHAFADVSLGEEASADRTMYMFHPALLDGGVTCVAGALPGLESDAGTTASMPSMPSMPSGLYLPLSYDSFRAVALIRDRCTTRIRHDNVRQRLSDLGYEPVGSTSAQFAAFIKGEIAKWAKVIKSAGIELR